MEGARHSTNGGCVVWCAGDVDEIVFLELQGFDQIGTGSSGPVGRYPRGTGHVLQVYRYEASCTGVPGHAGRVAGLSGHDNL